MSTYAIGDIQGCYQELLDLLGKINFDQTNDQLWFTGDLVNRGPHSLETLRFVKELGDKAIVTLGNHDLHLLAVALNTANKHTKDTIDSILDATDRNELLDWLRSQPLLYHDKESGFTLVHAGLLPQWDVQQAIELAQEVEYALAAGNYTDFFTHMYGNKPDHWSDDLQGWDRLRVIVNTFTRMRYCDEKGNFALNEKGPPGTQHEPYQPWFTVPARKTKKEKIVFGHWSTIYFGNIKNFQDYNVYPLDTGCLWGGCLTALRLDDETWYSVPSIQPKRFDK
jgi:bis(5'-nucleosyl)-tetraphosphatase (symmetrical)